ncbi:MAG: antibiotic biosynthesis monooxygenase [Thermodesulfobacteriota bacterium]
MVAREWRCRCPQEHRDGFLAYLAETGVKDTAATPCCRGAQILVRELDGAAEITLVTYWDSLDAIRAYAGEDISVARLYPEDAKYELDPDRRVTHYRVVEQVFR